MLYCEDKDGKEMVAITPLDFKTNRIRPCYGCEKLKQARVKGEIMDVVYQIDNGIGISWIEQINY
jgi:hypothetical protein